MTTRVTPPMAKRRRVDPDFACDRADRHELASYMMEAIRDGAATALGETLMRGASRAEVTVAARALRQAKASLRTAASAGGASISRVSVARPRYSAFTTTPARRSRSQTALRSTPIR